MRLKVGSVAFLRAAMVDTHSLGADAAERGRDYGRNVGGSF